MTQALFRMGSPVGPVLTGPHTASKPEAARERARAQWIDLHARLLLAISELGSERTRELLRRNGVRRPRTAVKQLARALSNATRMAASMGLTIPLVEVHRRVGELARSQDYRYHLLQLRGAYDALLHNPVVPARMHDRIRTRLAVHAFQLEDLGTVETVFTLPPR